MRARTETSEKGLIAWFASNHVAANLLMVVLLVALAGAGLWFLSSQIVPDVEVRPTINGIREGRDEVLEEAIRQIVGKEAATKQITAVYR